MFKQVAGILIAIVVVVAIFKHAHHRHSDSLYNSDSESKTESEGPEAALKQESKNTYPEKKSATGDTQKLLGLQANVGLNEKIKKANDSGAVVSVGIKEGREPGEVKPEIIPNVTKEQHANWKNSLDRVGFHEITLDPKDVLAAQNADRLPAATIESYKNASTLVAAAPNPGTVTISFNYVQANCPLLSNFQLQIPAIINVDQNGHIIEAVSQLVGYPLPTEIYSCSFQPVYQSGAAIPVTVLYRPVRASQ